MPVRWDSIVVDCRDPQQLGRWWAEVLGYTVAMETDEELVIVPPAVLDDPTPPGVDRGAQGIVFGVVPEDKQVKNRIHIDVRPRAGDDQDAEVERLLAMGATRADVGQDEAQVSWVVLADPEGNEFCVLAPPAG